MIKNSYVSNIFTAKNVLLIYVPVNKDEQTTFLHSRSVEKIIFEKINPYKEIVFEGAGEYWDAQFKVRYFEYFMKDKEGKIYYDSYHIENGELTYKGNKQEVNKIISYRYETTAGEGSGQTSLNKNGKTNLGNSGGNGSIPHIKKLVIKWNGKIEEIDLKAINKLLQQITLHSAQGCRSEYNKQFSTTPASLS